MNGRCQHLSVAEIWVCANGRPRSVTVMGAEGLQVLSDGPWIVMATELVGDRWSITVHDGDQMILLDLTGARVKSSDGRSVGVGSVRALASLCPGDTFELSDPVGERG